MKDIILIIKNDFKNHSKLNILKVLIILSILFASLMAFFPNINPLLFVYITVFVLPVIIYSLNIYIEIEEKRFIPETMQKSNIINFILAKISSNFILLLIPLVLYVSVMAIVLHMSFNILFFILIYILSGLMHIIIALVLAIISKSVSIISISYIGYIVIFALIPLFYSEGLIPNIFKYILIISPAYLSGILFEEVIYGYSFSPVWLIILAVLLQILYIIGLIFYVAKPYFESYLLFRMNKEK